MNQRQLSWKVTLVALALIGLFLTPVLIYHQLFDGTQLLRLFGLCLITVFLSGGTGYLLNSKNGLVVGASIGALFGTLVIIVWICYYSKR